MRVDGIFLEVKPVLSSCPKVPGTLPGLLWAGGLVSYGRVAREFLERGERDWRARWNFIFSKNNFECLENRNQESGTRRFADRGKLNW